MQNLTQLIYISRATFAPTATQHGFEPHVARILAKSRANNRHTHLTGVLYFGDGCFFQCLEGNTESVDTLYAKLQLDDRHTNIQLLSHKPIDSRSFDDWSMKYVLVEKDIERLLREHGHHTFDPYQFNAETVQALRDVFAASDDADRPTDPPHPENNL